MTKEELASKIEELENQKLKAIQEGNYQRAADLRDRSAEYSEKLNVLLGKENIDD
jgi:excinuclease UvrABC helicase subunit UvrB